MQFQLFCENTLFQLEQSEVGPEGILVLLLEGAAPWSWEPQPAAQAMRVRGHQRVSFHIEVRTLTARRMFREKSARIR